MRPVERGSERDDGGQRRSGGGRGGIASWPVAVWLWVLACAVGTCAYALAARLGRPAAMATTATGPLPGLSSHDGAAGELEPAQAARHHRSHRHSADSPRGRCRPPADRSTTRGARRHGPRLATPSPHTHRTTPGTRHLAGSTSASAPDVRNAAPIPCTARAAITSQMLGRSQ